MNSPKSPDLPGAPAASAPTATGPSPTAAPKPPALLRLLPADVVLPLPAKRSLLEAAEAAGWRLPRSCRNGTCRACLAQMTAGKVTWRVDWPGLSAEEKAQNWVLPCVAEAASEEISLLAPGARNMAQHGSTKTGQQ